MNKGLHNDQSFVSSGESRKKGERMKKICIIVLVLLVITVFSAACVQNADAPNPGVNNETTGTIRVSGAFALYPMMVIWAEEYHKIHPGVKILVSAGGAGQGMMDVLSGQSDLGMVSRDIYPAEISKGAVWVSVTKDAVVPVMNKNNPVSSDVLKVGINKSTFSGIFIGENVTNWGMIVNKPEIRGKIRVYTRSDASGAGEIWAKYMGNYTQNDLRGTGVSGDPGIAGAVKMDSLGIGYNNINFAYDPTTGKPVDGLAIVPLDLNENGKIDPNEDFYESREGLLHAIDTGKYPSPPSRELNIVAKNTFSGISRDFIHWILTDGQHYVQNNGYIPLPEESLQRELQKIG
jgi:phosphate transport system substrate-binding protein